MGNMINTKVMCFGSPRSQSEIEMSGIHRRGEGMFYLELDEVVDDPRPMDTFLSNVTTDAVECVVNTHLYGNGICAISEFVTHARMVRPDLKIKLNLSLCYLPHSRYFTAYDKACFDKFILFINAIGFDGITFGPISREAIKNVTPSCQCVISKFMKNEMWRNSSIDLPLFDVICHTDTTDVAIGAEIENHVEEDSPYQIVAACGYENLERGNYEKRIGTVINSKRFKPAELNDKTVMIIAYDMVNLQSIVELANDIKAGGAKYIGLYLHQGDVLDNETFADMINGSVINAAYCEFIKHHEWDY